MILSGARTVGTEMTSEVPVTPTSRWDESNLKDSGNQALTCGDCSTRMYPVEVT